MISLLPVATTREVRAATGRLLHRHRTALVVTLMLHALAVVAGLAGPQILRRVVDSVRDGVSGSRIDRLALLFTAALVIQAVLTRWARMRAAILAESLLADLREDFLRDAVALPLDTVERAGTGDLVARATTDVERLTYAVRAAAPELTVAALQVVLIAGAAVFTSPLLSLVLLVSIPPICVVLPWYRRRAPAAFQNEMAAEARVTAGIVETAEAGRTIEALGLGARRIARTEADVRSTWLATSRATFLRCVFFPASEIAYVLPMVSIVLFGGLAVARDTATVGDVTAMALYIQMFVSPLDVLLSWFNELQMGAASLARLLGVGEVPAHETTPDVPQSDELVASDVRFAYRKDHDVLHGVSIDVPPGTRLAIVGPSGAGKSTLGRLLAGIHPPRTGRVTIGGVAVAALPPDVLREQVALVTQEHHVFVGTVRENIALARPGASDTAVRAALDAVDALPWVDALPAGLDTVVGGGATRLAPAQAQQVALARIILADPHTLVLDEATALLDPRAARHLERSLAAVLRGRTVVAIAHRLHTAHDADVVAVVEGGEITELGSHDELLATAGSYAALWDSWRADTHVPR